MAETRSIFDAAQSGDQLETLVALRDFLANELDSHMSSRDIAPTANALRDTLDAIEDLKSAEGDPETDRIVGDLGEKIAGMSNVVNLK